MRERYFSSAGDSRFDLTEIQFPAAQHRSRAMTVTLSSPKTMPPPTGYSQIAEVTKGKLVLIAGQVAHDADGNLVGENDFAAQVEQVFKNLDAAVRAAGGTFKDIVKINNYAWRRSTRPRSRPSARSATATSTPRRRRSAPSSS